MMIKVFDGENGVAIAGITAITAIVGTQLLTKNRYKVDAQKGENSIALTPTDTADRSVTDKEKKA